MNFKLRLEALNLNYERHFRISETPLIKLISSEFHAINNAHEFHSFLFVLNVQL